MRFSSPERYCEGLFALEFDLDQSANGGSARMKYISDRPAMAGSKGANPALERAAANDTNHLSKSGKFRPLLGLYRPLAQHLWRA
jgi:hypothetical protein